MPVDITIPSPGESITEVTLGPWHKSAGDWVEKDETLVEIESDKVTLEVPAPESGLLSVSAEEGEERNVGDVIGAIDTSAERPKEAPHADAQGSEPDTQLSQAEAQRSEASGQATAAARNEIATANAAANGGDTRVTSLARKIADDRGVDLASVRGTGPGGRITKSDVMQVPAGAPAGARAAPAPSGDSRSEIVTVAGARGTRREKMTKLRQRIAQRLVMSQHSTAMLTTFNECDMSAVMALRKQHKESFAEKHGVGLGFMSFFSKAAISALYAFPRVNAYIVGEGSAMEIEFHDFVDLSIAVGTDKGLVVPVLRNAERMSFADIERGIKDVATRARDGKLSVDEMTGGTFTISNGGVYGSLMSTPILNPPQSGILGLHKIMNRAVEDPDYPGQIVLRPMMYIALSYDHRIIDGAESVGFLRHIKDCIEKPERMLLGV